MRELAVERSRQSNLGFNLFSILQKYTVAGSFLREMTNIIKKVNSGSDDLPVLKSDISGKSIGMKPDASTQSLKRF